MGFFMASREDGNHKGNLGSSERPLRRKLKLSSTITYIRHDGPRVGMWEGAGHEPLNPLFLHIPRMSEESILLREGTQKFSVNI